MSLTWEEVENILGKDLKLTVEEDFHEEVHQTQFYGLPKGYAFIFRYLNFKNQNLDFETEYYLNLKDELWSYKNGQFHSVCHNDEDFLDLLYDRFERNKEIVLLYSNQIDELEDILYSGKTNSAFMNTWFDLKKELSRVERYLNRQIFAHKDFLKYGEKQSNFPVLDFGNYINDIQFLLATNQGLLSRLDNAHNYFTSLKNDKLNKNIYLLTVLSGIFLPLNLIVGFFGMNTEGLLFKDDPNGTTYVLYALTGIFLAFVLGFNILNLIDRFFFRWWLGRSKLYSKMSNKIEEAKENWTF